MWAIALVILIVAGFLIPKLGRTLLVVGLGSLVLGVVGGCGVWAYSAVTTRLARGRIPVTDVVVKDALLTADTSALATRNFSARIENRSRRHTLTELSLAVQVQDCTSDTTCVVVQEDTMNLSPMVPSGQSRDVTGSVYSLSQPRFKGEFSWSYSIVGTQGK